MKWKLSNGFSLLEILFCLLFLSSIMLIMLYVQWEVMAMHNKIISKFNFLQKIDDQNELSCIKNCN